MIEADIRKLFPRFILEDKNGYAMAKALEAGLKYFLRVAQEGLETIQDPDKMPEWRLDEMAEEYNILYDRGADILTKRRWIKDAINYYSLMGTAEGMIRYLSAKFDTATVEEAAAYGGEPFHFRVTASEMYTEENDLWAQRAIARLKPARAVLDNIIYQGGEAQMSVKAGSNASGTEIYERTNIES
jgi:hypothetical protein